MIPNFGENFKKELININSQNFEQAAISLFDYQYENCLVYKNYCDLHYKNPSKVTNLNEIPFLPVEFFKSKEIKSGKWKAEKIFKSSGTTGSIRSQHLVKDVTFYLSNATIIFEEIVGKIENFKFLATLPSYLQQGNSSLIEMVNHFINKGDKRSRFISTEALNTSDIEPQTILFGVTYALLDLAERIKSNIPFIIIETGGMKGKRKEITREELNKVLKSSFPHSKILSEYGMTELLSQGYGDLSGFTLPKWMSVSIRDINDPFHLLEKNKTGGINIIDLANVDSCGFIETKDLGRINSNGKLEVIGRFDNSDLRGCNLLV